MFSGFGGGGGGSSAGDDLSQGFNQSFTGFFGHSDKPYRESGKVLEDYLGRARDTQTPFLQMGKEAIPDYQQWLQGQRDPSGFINNLMRQYSESPWAKYQQDQSMRAAGNMGSASGLTGSTPLTQFAQQNAHDISQQDMSSWLQNVLGINTQYGSGLQNEINSGQNAANSLSKLYSDFGGNLAASKYNSQAAHNQDKVNKWGGLFRMGEGAAKAYFGGGMM